MRLRPRRLGVFVLAGFLTAAVLLVLFYPWSCAVTAMGIPPGGPDPNSASCGSLVPAGSISVQGEPGTDRTLTSEDVLWQRVLARTALLLSPLLVGVLLEAAALRQRRQRPKDADVAPS